MLANHHDNLMTSILRSNNMHYILVPN